MRGVSHMSAAPAAPGAPTAISARGGPSGRRRYRMGDRRHPRISRSAPVTSSREAVRAAEDHQGGPRARTTFWQIGHLREGANKLARTAPTARSSTTAAGARTSTDKLTDRSTSTTDGNQLAARSQGRLPPSCPAPSPSPHGRLDRAVRRACSAPWSASIARSSRSSRPARRRSAVAARSARRDHDRASARCRGAGVMQYNLADARNKAIGEELARFANYVHGYMMSGGAVSRRRPGPLGRASGRRKARWPSTASTRRRASTRRTCARATTTPRT